MQYNATIVLIECVTSDITEWSRRLLQRGIADAGTSRGHKPGCLEDALQIIERNSGSEQWPKDFPIPFSLEIDTTLQDTNVNVALIMTYLRDRGLIPNDAT